MFIGRLKSLSKDILYYGVGNMLYTFIQLIAMPVIIRDMSMKEVANWNILLPTGALLCAIVTFGMDSAIVRFIVDENESRKKVIFSTGFYFVMSLALIASFSLWIFSRQTAGIINISREYMASYWILLYWLPGVILAQFFQNWFKYTFQRSRFVSVIALQSAVYLVAILCLKILGQIDLRNIMLAYLISIWMSALLGLFLSYNVISFRIDSKILVKLLIYGSPFLIMAFGYNFIFSFDKYVLSRNIAQVEFAIYSQSFRIAAIFSMVVSSFNFAFGPFSLSLLNKEDAPYTFAYIRTYYLFFMCLAGTLFVAVSKVVILFLAGHNYIEGNKFLPFFIVGYIFYGVFSFAQLGMIQSRKSYLGIYVLICGIVATVGLDLMLIPKIKGYGTAIGFAIGNLTMVLMADVLSKKFFKINYNNFKDTLLIAAFILCSLSGSILFAMDNIYMECLIKLIISISIFALISFSPTFKSERSLFWQTLSDVISRSKWNQKRYYLNSPSNSV